MPSKREAAVIVAAEAPDAPGWPLVGRVVPAATWVSRIRDAGWPLVTVDVLIPQREHHGPRAGQQTSDAVQPATCVPRAWLARMAELMQRPWGEACRYIVPDGS